MIMRTVSLSIVGGTGNNGGGAGALPAAGGAGAPGAGGALFPAGAGVGNLGKPKRGVCGEAAQVATQWSCAAALCALIATTAANAHTMNARRNARFNIFPPGIRNEGAWMLTQRKPCGNRERPSASARADAARGPAEAPGQQRKSGPLRISGRRLCLAPRLSPR